MSVPISQFIPVFGIGERVYFKLGEPGDNVGHVTSIIIEPSTVMYRVCWCDTSVSCHYAFELSTEQNYGNN